MSDTPSGTKQASDYLHYLLDKEQYRAIWQAKVERAHPNRLNQSAVCKVLADHLGRRAPEAIYHRSLKETVSRALGGTTLTGSTLDSFIAAFGISSREATTLRSLLAGAANSLVITDSAQLSAAAERSIGRVRHRTLSIWDAHQVGSDRLPAFHHTIQTITALEDGLDRYSYRFDTNAAMVSVVRGGKRGDLYKIQDTNLFAVDINFASPLGHGQTAVIEYVTTFAYQEPVPTEFRRFVRLQSDRSTIVVQFHPDALPTQVWRTQWDGTDARSRVSWREIEELDGDHSAHWLLDQISQAVVGYSWVFD